MGDFAYDLTGSTSPFVRKMVIGGTIDPAGQLMEGPNAGEAGITEPTTTAAADVVGINLDTATYVTAQQTDGTSANRVVSVVCNPFSVYKFLMTQGATNGAALTLFDVTTASTDGLAVTTGDDFSTTTFDEGVIWGYDGANAGQARKITSVSATAATVTVAFDYDTVVGDNFLAARWWPNDAAAITAQFSTSLDQVDASIAVGTGAAIVVVELVLKDSSDSGRTNSYLYLMSDDNDFNLLT